MPHLPRLAPPLLLAVLLSALVSGCSKQAAAPEPERAVRTQLVSTGTASASHEYAAEVKARVESRLSFRVSGKLLNRAVNLGDTVKAGQVLARIDAQDLRLAEAAAAAGVAAARRPRTTSASSTCNARASSARPNWSGASRPSRPRRPSWTRPRLRPTCRATRPATRS
jgi:multidrug efflux pump subunit AcrA (membrane-fusion protein)